MPETQINMAGATRRRSGRIRSWPAILAATAAMMGGIQAVPAAASVDPVFLGWPSTLIPQLLPYQPGSADSCRAGRFSCVRHTISRMDQLVDTLAARCDHRSVFALAYLRTTQEYLRAAQTPGFFQDVPFMNHYDSVFASYFFASYDAWPRAGKIPPAWQIAFDAAAARTVSGTGDLLLGMNAHVNRDLPFVLASIGLVAPDGTSRKADHDKVNVFLNRVVQPLLAEEAARFDPAMDDAGTPFGLSYTALMQLLVGWREGAWRNAELLVGAPDNAARSQVARQIEESATLSARTIQASQSYVPPLTSTASRDAFCAAHH